MPQFAWLTDIHLNAVDRADREAFYAELRLLNAEAILLGGDIGEGYTTPRYLEELNRVLACPVYFVLGNHDYYRSSFVRVREGARSLAELHHNLVYLPAAGLIRLNSETALIGHGGWGDAHLGNFETSPVKLNDFRLIAELAGLKDGGLKKQLNRLGDEAAAHIWTWGKRALAQYRSLYVLMHVPPFAEACWYEGQAGHPDWTPHFACGAAGQALSGLAEQFPHAAITVLCGHTHHAGVVDVRANLRVHTASATYGKPKVAELITL